MDSETFEAWLNRFETLPFSHVTADSRTVRPGSLFVALKGLHQNGQDYLQDAIQRGATHLVGNYPLSPQTLSVPYWCVQDPARALSLAAATLFKHPSRELFLIGVTGTSGKTSTTCLIEHFFRTAKIPVGLIGTLESRYQHLRYSTGYTTPNAPELHQILREMRAAGCQVVVMEVSSHALKQQRVADLAFNMGIWTNFSPEHLDFHPNLEDYFHSKAEFFRTVRKRSEKSGKRFISFLNAEEPLLKPLQKELKAQKAPVVSFQVGSDLSCSSEGLRGTLQGLPISVPLLGRFNASNLAAALAVTQTFGLSKGVLKKGLQQLPAIPGRLEKIPHARGVHVWVDYAHKPDALEKVLKELRTFKKNPNQQLRVVFGCGGNRDPYKRPTMGAIALQYAEEVWITSDNPRFEDPLEIIEAILKGVRLPSGALPSSVRVEPDRVKAIQQAIRGAKPGDLVLITGKGHETGQIIKDQVLPLDDRKIAQEAETSGLTVSFETL